MIRTLVVLALCLISASAFVTPINNGVGKSAFFCTQESLPGWDIGGLSRDLALGPILDLGDDATIDLVPNSTLSNAIIVFCCFC